MSDAAKPLTTADVEAIADLDRIQWQVGPELARLRALVAELVTALEGCTEWMGCNPPADGWGLLDQRADADRHEAIKAARAALAKAKGGA